MILKVKHPDIDVRILNFSSPHSFFCQSIINNTAITVADEIALAVDKSFETISPKEISHQNLKYGTFCAVKYKDRWVRACCQDEEKLWLIDYAKIISTAGLKFFVLPYGFSNVPSDVFHCALDKVSSSRVVWSGENMVREAADKWDEHALTLALTLILKSSIIKLRPLKIMEVYATNKIMILGDIILTTDNETYSLSKHLIKKSFALKNKSLYENRSRLFPFCRMYSANESRDMRIFDDLITKEVAFKLDFFSNDELSRYTMLSIQDEKIFAGKTIHGFDGKQHDALEIVRKKLIDFNMCKAYQNYDEKCTGRGCLGPNNRRIVDLVSINDSRDIINGHERMIENDFEDEQQTTNKVKVIQSIQQTSSFKHCAAATECLDEDTWSD